MSHQATTSAVLHKLDVITKQTESNDVLWAAVIGAIAATLPQLIILIYTHWNSKKKEKLEIKAELHRLWHLLKDHYRELAMFKAHKFYWYAHVESIDAQGQYGDKEERKLFYSKHMDSSEGVRNTELKISETFSEFYKMVIKFQHLTSFDEKIKSCIDNFYNYIPPKPTRIDSTLTDLVGEERKLEDQLILDYNKYLEHLNGVMEIIKAR